MEYTIYDESLVYYALKNPETLRYYDSPDSPHGVAIQYCKLIPRLNEAESLRLLHPEFSEIRKVKMIDIGKIETND